MTSWYNRTLRQLLTKIYRDALEQLHRGDLLRQRLRSEPHPPYSQILALGKSAATMAALAKPFAAASVEGFVLTRRGHLNAAVSGDLTGFECWEGGHPVPDEGGLRATRRLLAWLEEVRAPRHLLLLVSGGTSALLEQPSPPLDLDDLRALNRALLASGQPITTVNVVRKHLSLVKGGGLGLRLAARFGRVTQLIASDVVCETPRLDLVGSGPALADPSHVGEAEAVLRELEGLMSRPLLRRCRAALRETPKSLALTAELLADHTTLARFARDRLGSRAGSHPEWKEVVTDDIGALSRHWGELAVRLQAESLGRGEGIVLLATGEPTVRLHPRATGRGGRCQELAVRFARAIAGRPGIALLAGSSDGSDGPTPHAGALVDGQTWPRLCQILGEQGAQEKLETNDSSGLLEALPETLLDTGPTGQNLNDLFMLGLYPDL